jgi:hypothetical protein
MHASNDTQTIPMAAAAFIGVLCLAVIGTATAREPETYTERVQFTPGTIKDVLGGALGPGESRRYLLNARDGQELRVALLPNNAQTHFNIFVPGGEMLYDGRKGGNYYRGGLYKTGDHVVEVYYLGHEPTSNYEVEIVIE